MALSDAAVIAAIGAVVALASTLSPIIQSVISSRQRRKEKAEDYARQDAVAAQAAEAARLLLAANERVARQTATATIETQGQLRQIHTLVNSKLTEEMKGRLVALDAQIVLTERLDAATGIDSTDATRTALANLRHTADELRHSLAEREILTEDAARSRE